MATTPVCATLCEVAYDSDHRLTPYRYQFWNSPPKTSVHFSGKDVDQTESTSAHSGFESPDWANTFSLPSSSCTGSYLDYLRTLYECKSSCSSKSSKTHRGNYRTGHHSARSSYIPTQVSPRVTPAAYGYADNRPKTASIPPTQPLVPQQQYSLPALHHGRAWGLGEEEGREDGEGDNKPDDRLVWVDALGKWIPENQLQKPSYVSFIGTAPVVEKLYATLKETPVLHQQDCAVCDHKCTRYEIHMEQHKNSVKCGLCGLYHQAVLPPNHLHTHRLVTLKKREALRKRANEAAAERKQRKAYSSPLYSSLKDKRQKVRFQTPESESRSGVSASQNDVDLDLHVMLPKDTLLPDGQTEEGTDGQTEDDTEITGDSTEDNLDTSEADIAVKSTDSSEQQTDPVCSEWSLREGEYVIVSKSEIDIATDAMEAADAEHREQLRMFEEMRKKREEEKAAALAAALAKEEADRLAEEELINAEIAGEDLTMFREDWTSDSVSTGQSHGQNVRLSRPKVSVRLPSLSHKNKKSSASVSSSNSSGQLKTSSSKVKASKSTSRTSTSRSRLDKKSSSKLNNKLSQEPSLPEISDVMKHTQSASSSLPIVKPPPILAKLPEEEVSDVKIHMPVESHDKTAKVTSKGSKAAEEKPAQLGFPLPHMDMSLPKPQPVAFLQTGHERGEDNSKVSTQVIPTVGDTRTGPLSLTVDDRPPSRGRSPSGRQKFSIIKKERGDRRRVGGKVDSPVESPTQELPSRRTGSWIYGQDDDDDSLVVGNTERKSEGEELPPLPTDVPPPLPDPDRVIKSSQKTSDKRRQTSIQTPIVKKLEKKLKRRQFSKDTSYEDELRQQELAEQRRQKHMEMLEKARARKHQGDINGDGNNDGPNFDDYGFLAKYCIFNKTSVEMFKHTFDNVDDEDRGWLSATEVMVALRAVNNKLSRVEEEYLYRILELTGYSIKNGADFKLFSVVAALSQKIAALDNWMRNMIGKMDFSMLEMKLFMCKKLWECNVDPETNKISIDQLCVELRAGGVSLAHETEVRQKLSHMDALDLLDFLTYIPLFIMIHQSVVDNPLDDTRDK